MSASYPNRRIILPRRGYDGFGFTLRHFVVYPDKPHDFDNNLPLQAFDTIFVKSVKKDSVAHMYGLSPGDRLIAVNDVNICGLTYSQVLNLIQTTSHNLVLTTVASGDTFAHDSPSLFDDRALNSSSSIANNSSSTLEVSRSSTVLSHSASMYSTTSSCAARQKPVTSSPETVKIYFKQPPPRRSSFPRNEASQSASMNNHKPPTSKKFSSMDKLKHFLHVDSTPSSSASLSARVQLSTHIATIESLCGSAAIVCQIKATLANQNVWDNVKWQPAAVGVKENTLLISVDGATGQLSINIDSFTVHHVADPDSFYLLLQTRKIVEKELLDSDEMIEQHNYLFSMSSQSDMMHFWNLLRRRDRRSESSFQHVEQESAHPDSFPKFHQLRKTASDVDLQRHQSKSTRIKVKDIKKWTSRVGRSLSKKYNMATAATPPPATSNSGTSPPTANVESVTRYSLETAEPSLSHRFVPAIVELCTAIIEARGLEVVGIYRLSGNQASVNFLLTELNKGLENVNFDNEKWMDVHVVSSLLKKYLRLLEKPLIPSNMYDMLIAAHKIQVHDRKLLNIKRLLAQIREHHLETLSFLCKHLHLVTQYCDVNKMDAQNLAIIFAPTVFRLSDHSESAVLEMGDQCGIMYLFIRHYDWFFSSWESDFSVPSEVMTNMPASSCNQAQLNRAASAAKPTPKEVVSKLISTGVHKIKKRKSIKRERNRTLIAHEKNDNGIDISPARHGFEVNLNRSYSAENLNKATNSGDSLSPMNTGPQSKLTELEKTIQSLKLRKQVSAPAPIADCRKSREEQHGRQAAWLESQRIKVEDELRKLKLHLIQSQQESSSLSLYDNFAATAGHDSGYEVSDNVNSSTQSSDSLSQRPTLLQPPSASSSSAQIHRKFL